MILKNEDGKLNFIVSTQYAIAYPEKGASIVLNKLAYEIAIRGHNVYVFDEPYFPHENIKVIPTKLVEEDNPWKSKFIWEQFSFPSHKTISIYNQVTFGNPYNTIHNVRWVLHDFSQEQWNNFDKDDVIYNFGDFKVPENTKQSQLTVFDYKLDKFKNLNNSYRKGFCSLRQDGKTKTTPENSEEFFDVNSRIVSLESPFLTDEAKENVDLLINEKLDQEGRSYKNSMKMMTEDGLFNVLPKSDDSWIKFINPFLRLTRKEKNKRTIKIKNNE